MTAKAADLKNCLMLSLSLASVIVFTIHGYFGNLFFSLLSLPSPPEKRWRRGGAFVDAAVYCNVGGSCCKKTKTISPTTHESADAAAYSRAQYSYSIPRDQTVSC